MEAGQRQLPYFPDPLTHVWECFADLGGTRTPAQILAPITYAEIDAYNRTTLAGLTAWEVRLIRRIDTAVRAVSIGKVNPNSQISARDGKAVASMFRGIAKRRQRGEADG